MLVLEAWSVPLMVHDGQNNYSDFGTVSVCCPGFVFPFSLPGWTGLELLLFVLKESV